MPACETVIIGGGIAGLACARRLHRAGRDFRLVTDRLGGRMFANGGATRNFGAAYLTSDYRHVGRFVGRGPRIRRRDVFFPDGDVLTTLFHPRNLKLVQALARLLAEIARFRGHWNRLRAASPHVCQAELLARDPLLARATHEPAGEFARRKGLAELGATFIDPIVYSTIFVKSESINAFYYLAVLMPVLLPTYLADFTTTLDRLTAGYRDRIVVGRVLSVEGHARGGFTVATGDRDFQARNVVVATPTHNLREFCPELDRAGDDGLREVSMATLHVRGRRRHAYRPGKVVFLGDQAAATILLPIGGGLDVLYARTANPDLSPYYEEYTITDRVWWKTAVQITGARWRRLSPRPGLFTIGDYNICGLEDSYLTGLYAANRIIG
jgi:glycine/D-amino acid oxidase-like deaminating enzyme